MGHPKIFTPSSRGHNRSLTKIWNKKNYFFCASNTILNFFFIRFIVYRPFKCRILYNCTYKHDFCNMKIYIWKFQYPQTLQKNSSGCWRGRYPRNTDTWYTKLNNIVYVCGVCNVWMRIIGRQQCWILWIYRVIQAMWIDVMYVHRIHCTEGWEVRGAFTKYTTQQNTATT